MATYSLCVTWLSNVWHWTDHCVKTFSCLQCKRHSHISQNASPYLPPPPSPQKILHNLCFSFLLGITAVPREIENNAYAKFWVANKVYYGKYVQVAYILWFNGTLGLNSFLLCFGMVMYVNGGFEQGKIKFKPRLKLYHKIYIHSVILAFQSFNLIGSLPWAILHKGYYSFKIFLSFWLAQIPRLIVMQNQKCSKSCKGSIGLERRELSEWVIFHSRIYWMTQWLQWQVWQPLKCFFTDGPLHSLTGYLRHSPQVQMWKRSWLGLLHCKLN